MSRPLGVINPALMRVLNRSAFDAVLIHGYMHLSEWLAFAACSVQKLPYVIRGESWLDVESGHSAARRSIKRALVGPALRGAAACIAIGRRNKEYYLSYGVPSGRIFFAPYGVDNDRFAAAGKRGRANRNERLSRLGLDPALPLILFVGKFYELKRPLDAIRAVSGMTVAANLVLIGDGPLRSLVEGEAARHARIRAIGFVNQGELGEWYGASDVTVVTSRRETWGLVVNEAMAAGSVPVVTESTGCAPDLVTEDTGRQFPVGDTARLCVALDEVLGDPSLLRRLRANAGQLVRRFSVEAGAQGTESAALQAAPARSRHEH